MKILQEITVPHESVNDEYLTVVSKHFADGMQVKKHDIILELETSKATLSIEAQVDGFIMYRCNVDDEVAVNSVIATIGDSPMILDKELPPLEKEGQNFTTSSNANQIPHETRFSKKALEAMVRYRLDASTFSHLDFVTEQMVNSLASPSSKVARQEVRSAGSKQSAPAKIPENARVEKLSPNKKREIEYLSSVQQANLVSTIYIEIDVNSFFDSVREHLLYFNESLLPVTIYEVARLLIKFPMFNAFYSDQSIVYYQDVNIGIAIDINLGLKVVRIPSANHLTLRQIEDKLLELSNRYLDQKLQSEDLSDISFTITDLSQEGARFFTPLINKDNSAILGMSSVDEKRRTANYCLAFDHRVTEGKMATAFLMELKKALESYSLKSAKRNDIQCSKCMKRLSDDLNDIGFIKIVNSQGDDKFICDGCLLNT